jgi:hypothetical protein
MPEPLPARPRKPPWYLALPPSNARALLVCSFLVTLGFLIFCSFVLLDARNDAKRQADQAASNIVSVVEQDVARNIELFDESLRNVSERLQLPGISELSPQIRNMLLFDRTARARYLGFINALNESGDVIADSRATPPRGGNFAGREYFLAHRRDPRDILFIGRPIQTDSDAFSSITISRRMSHPDGSFAGVVVGSIQLAYFRNLFSGLAVGPRGIITLLRNDGRILMRLPFNSDDVGHSVTPGSPFHRFMQTREPRIEAVTIRDGLSRRFTYRQIGDLPLVVGVGFAVDDIFAIWRVKATSILLVVAGLCLANIALTLLLRHHLHRRAMAEAAAHQSAAEFRQLTENVSDIVTKIDAHGVYRYVSPAARRVLGVEPESLLGRHLTDDLHPDDRAGFELWLARLRDNAAELTTRFRKRRPDGNEVWIEAVASPLTDTPTGEPEGFVILSRDVTARHQLELTRAERSRELERKNAELDDLAHKLAAAADTAEHASETKSRFLATMSHEVRTPLTAILGYAELLALEAPLDPRQAGRLAAMRSAGEHLRDLLNKVLDQARIEAQAASVNLAPIDLPLLLEQTQAQVEPAARAKGLPVHCEIDRNVPHPFVTDGTHLRQILLNLLHNAVKFTERGEIRVRVTRVSERLRCEVLDTGRGIPANQRDRLFQEYERLDADRAGIGGTGLGLSIAARLAKALGGSIGHQANPAGGSMFWIELPIVAAISEPPQAPRQEQPAHRVLRVLLVDDSATNRDVAASFLYQAGHTVVDAASGDAAVRLAATEDFDVVLMDMRMPGMDGLEASRRIRDLPGTRGRVAIVAVTAQVLDDQWETWSAAGINAYLAKPYGRTELLAAVALAALGPGGPGTDPEPPVLVPDAAVALPCTATATGLALSPQDAAGPQDAATQLPACNDETLAELAACLGPEVLAGHLQNLADRIAALLLMLRSLEEAADTAALSTMAHTIAGDAGQLGFDALSAAARGFMAALEREPGQYQAAAAALSEAASHAQTMLDQRLACSRSACMASANVA